MSDFVTSRQSDAKQIMEYENSKKSPGIAYVLWFFFGSLGGHRYYLGRTGSAIAMSIIFGISIVLCIVAVGVVGLAVVGCWALVDAFLIPGIAREYNQRLISSLTS
jgi:TM2 domain-containing membrane protein YozV